MNTNKLTSVTYLQTKPMRRNTKTLLFVVSFSLLAVFAQAQIMTGYQPVEINATNPYQMRTTSLLLDRRVPVAPMQSGYGFQYGTRSSSSYSQFGVISLFSKDSKYSRRRTWTRDGLFTADNFMSSGSAYASNVELNSGSAGGGPRRVGGNDHDPDPFMGEPVPLGDAPFVLIALLLAGYVLYASVRRYRKGARRDREEWY